MGGLRHTKARAPWVSDPLGGVTLAPVDAQYVTMALNATLTNERVLTSGTGISIVDGGAGGAVTINTSFSLSDGNIPNYDTGLSTLEDSPVWTDGSHVSINHTDLFEHLGVYSGNNTATQVSISAFSTTAGRAPELYFYRSGNATLGSVSNTVDGYSIGELHFVGGAGGTYRSAASITIIQNGASSTYPPSDMKFFTYGATAVNSNQLVLHNSGNVGLSEANPETLLELTGTAPYLTIHNSTEENGLGGRESEIIFKGEKLDTTEHQLAYIIVSHASAADDKLGRMLFYINDGADVDNALTNIFNLYYDSVNCQKPLGIGVASNNTPLDIRMDGVSQGGTLYQSILYGDSGSSHGAVLGYDTSDSSNFFYSQSGITKFGTQKKVIALDVGSDTYLGINITPTKDFTLSGVYWQQEADGLVPNWTLKNITHDDSDNGRGTTMDWRGERSGGEEVVQVQLDINHEGSSDDNDSKAEWYISDTTTLTKRFTWYSGKIEHEQGYDLHLPQDTNADFGNGEGQIFYDSTFTQFSIVSATEDLNISSAVDLLLSAASDILVSPHIKIAERGSASADTAAYGQIWVKDDTPNILKFTDDAGTDFNVALSDGTTGGAGSAGSGNQYVELNIGGTTYKVLHDGTV